MKKNVNIINVSRYVGNALTLGGYAILLNVDPLWGGAIKIVGLFMVLPSCYQLKLYDVMFMLGLFGVIDSINVIRILLSY